MGSSDYVLIALRKVIDRNGLFLAWSGHELVGMTNFEPCIDGAGWLSMARTDPAWRRKGVALFLQREIAKHAKREGINLLRLWITSDNKASILACEKGGFRRVCEAAHIHTNLRDKRKSTATPSSASHPLIQSCLKSNYLTRMNGYIGRQWHFLKPTTKLLEHLENNGELYSVGDCALLVTKPEKRFRQPQSSLTILKGPPTRSLRLGKEIARGLNARVLSAYIPYDRYQLAAAKRVGFRRRPWGKHCIIFEKRLH
ncbi:MAG TPA: GNAT family N-acetyltransferase [Candidatus Acidoferrales bacterium]|nr:GNAT family N-acetyltransferase [Candidatus Acidoferrales bacterium]